ncbi:MAG: FG-GAP-like repeat-containing protein, partial [Bacteroidales bacterium]|nr:FG-GAP-like repeat-containing protein [Bacteroidales bacterium]
MKKAYNIKILLLFILLSGTDVLSQENCGVVSVNTSHSGEDYNYISKEKISLKTGFSFSSSGGKVFNAKTDPYMLCELSAREEYNETNPYQHSKNLPVGTIPGAAGVSATGAATYEIPVFVSPGTAGMEPSVSIVYNSQSGNGLLGVGWNLSGLSAISMSPDLYYSEGHFEAVKFNNDGSTKDKYVEKYSFDGNPLVFTGESNNTEEFRTELESFRKITFTGNKFTVQTKDGIKSYYGSNDNSRLKLSSESGNRTLVWYIDKIEDNNGNYIKYEYYDNYNNEKLIKRISYTGNQNANLAPYNHIEFYYAERSDKSSNYVSGKEFKQSVVLEKIIVKHMGYLVKEYKFGYFVDPYTKLNEVTEYNGSGSKYNSTVIEWGEKDYGLSVSAIDNWSEITCSTGWYNINTQRVTGDFNGDGIDDLIIAGSFFDPSNTTDICTSGRLYLGSTGGLVLSEKFSVPFKATIYVIRTGPDHFYYTGLDRKDVIVFASRDPLSRDRVGILKENNISGYEWEINSTGTSSKYEIFIPGNFYENGTPCYLNTYTYTENWDNESWKRLSNIEIRYVKDDGNIGYKNITNPFNNSGKYHILDRNSSRDNFPKCNIDFDGDGVAEIIGIHEANGQKKVRIYEFDKYTEDFELLYDVPSSVIDPVNLQSNNNWFLFGDFNGDGKTDIFCKLINTYWKIYYSTGKGFTEGSDFTSELESNSGSDPSYKIYVADMNGDGLADIVEFKGYDQNNQRINKLLIHLNTGDGFYKIENGTINSYISNDEYFTIGDFNGDGKKDIIYFAGLLEQQFKISGFMLNDESRSVKKITNGIGHKTEFDYALMTEYNTGSNGINIYNDDYNYVSLLSPLKVVKKIRQPSGINNTMSESEYGYKDGLIHIKGKGFLGFEEVHSSNSTLNRFTKTINKFDFAYSAVNETETIVQTIDNENISKDRTKFLIRQMASSPPAWICVVPLFTSSWDYLYGSDNDSTLTTYEYYNQTGGTFLGNVKKVETNHTGCFTTKTEYEYNPSCLSLDNWNISKPVKITESRIQNGTHAMRNILTYDNKGNLTETTSDSYPVSGGYPLRRVYSYDACGNLLMSGGVGKVVIEAIDQYRTERYEYDELYRFVVKKIDKMNMSENMSYDPFFGNVLTKNDIFGNTTTYRYDKFGNLIQVISPRDNVTSISCLWSSGLNDVGVYKIITSSDGAPTIRSYYDILGRELRTTSDFYGETLVTEKTYSQDGLVEKENLPYFENSPTDNYKEYSYDNNKRLTSVTSMGLTTNYIHGSETLETIYPDSRQETKNYNKAGQLTSISSFNGDVSYTYHSSGNPSGITAGGSTTIMGYDKYGNQIRLTDVNTGQVNYTYNAFGELIIQTDAKLNKFRLYYDTGGRLVKKECYNNPEFTVNYTYYFSHNNLCLLKKEEMGNGTYKEYEYDEYANPVKISEYIDGELYTHEYTYDRYNNLISYKSPSSFTLTNHYDPQGFLVRVEHNGDVIWKLSGNSVNEMGQFLNYKLGPNEINCIFTYNNYYELTSQSYGQDFHYSYEWDHNEGNLLSRTDNITEMREEFEYNDNMDRLTGWMVYDAPYNQPISSYSAEYSPNGNIHYKTDIGYYTYDGTKIHAVTEISGAEPEFVPERNQITEYTPFNKVSSITEEDPLTGEV